MNNSTLSMEQWLKNQSIGNRRKVPRFDASAIPNLKSIHQVDGPEVNLINISRRGALIESSERILPGPNISLRIVTVDAVHIIKGRIVHYSIYPGSNRKVLYQFAFAFDEDFTILPAGTD